MLRDRNNMVYFQAPLVGAVLSALLFLGSLATPAQADSDQNQSRIHFSSLGPFEHHNVPGGIAIVPTGVSSDKPKPSVSWNKRVIAAMSAAGEWSAIVGVPLSTKSGAHQLNVTSGGNAYQVSFDITGIQYEEQRITLTDNGKVNPAPLDMERINKESARLKTVKRMRTETLAGRDFIWPVEGPISSTFGLRRFFNDQPRRPHGGIDIAMPTGTPIVAPANGVIIDTGDYFFNGNSVFIEHGLGVQTFYAHMDTISVSIGDEVKQGDVIGTVGATGRVTGAHLHWSVGLNGTWVDPTLVLAAD